MFFIHAGIYIICDGATTRTITLCSVLQVCVCRICDGVLNPSILEFNSRRRGCKNFVFQVVQSMERKIIKQLILFLFYLFIYFCQSTMLFFWLPWILYIKAKHMSQKIHSMKYPSALILAITLLTREQMSLAGIVKIII